MRSLGRAPPLPQRTTSSTPRRLHRHTSSHRSWTGSDAQVSEAPGSAPSSSYSQSRRLGPIQSVQTSRQGAGTEGDVEGGGEASEDERAPSRRFRPEDWER